MSASESLCQELDRLLGLLGDPQVQAEGSAPLRVAAKQGNEGSEPDPSANQRKYGTGANATDAITAELKGPARTTAVRSLRDAPEIEAFRQELIDGLIRADTANQLLRLINEVVTRLLR